MTWDGSKAGFASRFAHVFSKMYKELVIARVSFADMNELGDFTCQIFTREDVPGCFFRIFDRFQWV